MGYQEDYARNTADIYLRSASSRARSKRDTGVLIGNTLQSLGKLPEVFQQQREREQDRIAKQKQQQTENDLRQAELDIRRQQLAQKDDPNIAAKHALDLKLTQFEAAGRLLVDANADNWQVRRPVVLSVLGPEAAAHLPEEYPGDDVIKAHVAEGQTVESQLKAKQKAIDDATPKPKPDYTMNDQRFSGETNQVIATGAPPPMTPDQKADNARADAQLGIARAQLTLAQQRELRESQNSKEPLIAVMKDGKAVLVKRSQAEGMTPASAEGGVKELTQAQTLDAGYAHRIDDAEETLTKVEPTIAKMGLAKFTVESHVPAKMQSADFQQYDQASRNLINAILRRESGAAISQSEFDNAKRQYLPQPGDTDDTLKLKAKNRQRQKDALAQGAGRAYVPDTTVAAGPRDGETKPIPGFPGTEQTYRNGKWIRTK